TPRPVARANLSLTKGPEHSQTEQCWTHGQLGQVRVCWGMGGDSGFDSFGFGEAQMAVDRSGVLPEAAGSRRVFWYERLRGSLQGHRFFDAVARVDGQFAGCLVVSPGVVWAARRAQGCAVAVVDVGSDSVVAAFDDEGLFVERHSFLGVA